MSKNDFIVIIIYVLIGKLGVSISKIIYFEKFFIFVNFFVKVNYLLIIVGLYFFDNCY